MNWAVWDRVEDLLVARNVRPIVAVVPDNCDLKLQVTEPLPNFWERVREWQRRGWAIGWHGYQHLYDSSDAGIIGINRRSEFAGVSRDVQEARLKAAYEVFLRNGVRPDLWVAPAHSFDLHTLELLRTFGIEVVSDGFFVRPVMSSGFLWVPQQLWRFRNLPFGVWTVCYHVNAWGDRELLQFAEDVGRFESNLVCLAELLRGPRLAKTVFDDAFENVYRRLLLLKRAYRDGRSTDKVRYREPA
jgi:hypothetical protein